MMDYLQVSNMKGLSNQINEEDEVKKKLNQTYSPMYPLEVE